MRITKVYTRQGDAGKTMLVGGQEVWKDSLRVDAYGTVDELNAVVGMVRAFNADFAKTLAATHHLETELQWVQQKLFDVGAILATPSPVDIPHMPTVTEADSTHLEVVMDECQKVLAPLKEFVLPGGGKVSSVLHQARTVCRRAERLCVQLSREEPIDANVVKFLNRLSDAFFVLARWVAHVHNEPEFLWDRSKSA
jgi:cob(I)alamin adenosyltransferase